MARQNKADFRPDPLIPATAETFQANAGIIAAQMGMVMFPVYLERGMVRTIEAFERVMAAEAMMRRSKQERVARLRSMFRDRFSKPSSGFLFD